MASAFVSRQKKKAAPKDGLANSQYKRTLRVTGADRLDSMLSSPSETTCTRRMMAGLLT